MLTKIKNIIKIFFLKKNSSLHISTDLELNIMWLPRFCIKQSVFCPFSLWICTFSFLFSKDNSGVLWFPLWLLLLHTFPTPYPTHGQCQSPEFNLPNLSLTLTTVVIISYLIPPPQEDGNHLAHCGMSTPRTVPSRKYTLTVNAGKRGRRENIPFRGRKTGETKTLRWETDS